MSPQQKAELRRLTRAFLADRAALSFNLDSIHRGVSRQIGCTVPEVEESLTFLVGLNQISVTPDPLGSVSYYKITAQGTLAHERGE